MTGRSAWLFARRLGRQPALQFLVIGALLFGLHAAVRARSTQAPAAERTIAISPADLEVLAEDYRERTGAEADPATRRALAERYIDDEVLYREGLALGLHRTDPMIRRRLIQKMEFLLEDGGLGSPKEADLQRYLEQHADSFRTPALLSFEHIFFSRDRRGGQAAVQAARTRATLLAAADRAAETSALGDSFLLGTRFREQTPTAIARAFGPDFARNIAELPASIWSAPIESSYGLHLVRITARTPAQPARLAEVRARVSEAWTADRRAEVRQRALLLLRAGYRIEPGATAP